MTSAPDALVSLFDELKSNGNCIQFHVAQWLIRVLINKEYNLTIVYLDGNQFETKIYTNEFPVAAVVVDATIGYANGRKVHKNKQSVINELRVLRG